MAISRRGFLGRATGVSAFALASASRWYFFSPQSSKLLAGCTLVEPEPSCALRESVAGYESALDSSSVAFKRTSFESLRPTHLMIFPAAVFMNESKLAHIRAHLENGSVVLWESGAVFSNSKNFHTYRRFIKSAFGLRLHDPVRVWESADSFRQSPYIDYIWPVATKVRDFSRIIPIDCRRGETIAWFQNLGVSVKRRVGKGTLVFLGSPLGPHLLFGDKEAILWFNQLYSSC